jgi:hypothetical protein
VSLDKHFVISLDENVEVTFSEPVFLEKDIRMLMGAPPSQWSQSDTGSTMHYRFKRMSGDSAAGRKSLLEEFELLISFQQSGDQLRLSSIDSSQIPAEMMSFMMAVQASGLDEIGSFACEVRITIPSPGLSRLTLTGSGLKTCPRKTRCLNLLASQTKCWNKAQGSFTNLAWRGMRIWAYLPEW